MSPLESLAVDALWQVNTFGVHWDMAVQLLPSHVLATPERLAEFHRIADETRAELVEVGPLGVALGEAVLAKVTGLEAAHAR